MKKKRREYADRDKDKTKNGERKSSYLILFQEDHTILFQLDVLGCHGISFIF